MPAFTDEFELEPSIDLQALMLFSLNERNPSTSEGNSCWPLVGQAPSTCGCQAALYRENAEPQAHTHSTAQGGGGGEGRGGREEAGGERE